MSKMHQLSRYGSRSVLARACSAVCLQPLENRTLLSAALALDWGGIDNAYEVAVDGRGRIVVTGDSDDALVMARFARTGEALDLDETFGTEGGVALDFEPFGIEVQPDGKILLVGDDAEGTLLVARYNEDGTLDTLFADDGTAEFNLAADSLGNAIGIEPGGKIVVAGGAGDDLLVVRLERDGDLDTTFGGGGFVTTDFGGTDVALGIGILADGRIVVGGASDGTDYAIARYLPTGALDTTLGGDGTVSGALRDYDDDDALNVTDFAVLADGRMLVLGDGSGIDDADSDGVVYHFTPAGVEDREERDSLFRLNPHDEIAAQGYDYVIATSWHDEAVTDESGWHNHDFYAFGERTDFGGDDVDGLEFDEYVLGVALRDGVGAGVGVTGEDWGLFVTDYFPDEGPYTVAAHRSGQTIQVEDFDHGGEGNAYHDEDVVNQGGEYRVGGVDIGFTSDAGGGFAVGWTEPGEWLSYTIDVPEGGAYAFDVRVANPASGGRFHLELTNPDLGVRTLRPMDVPVTSGWHSYATVNSGPIFLDAGRYRLRLEMDRAASNGAVANFNWMRLNAIDASGTGTFDGTFGGGDGEVQGPNLFPEDGNVDVAVGPGDTIVMFGGPTLQRYFRGGTPDTAFGNNGTVQTGFDELEDVEVQDDGRIVVAGTKDGVFRVARYTSTGQLDTSFSGDGIAAESFGSESIARSLAIQPDGKIVAAGSAGSAAVVVRYNRDGSHDLSFGGGDGVATLNLNGDGSDRADDVEIAPGGRIVVLGRSDVSPGDLGDTVVLRLTPTGTLDTSFGQDNSGVVVYGDRFFAHDVAVQGDGRIYVAGAEIMPADATIRQSAVVRRLTTSGLPDGSFGRAGGEVRDLFATAETKYAFATEVWVLPDGDVIVVGSEDAAREGSEAVSVLTRLNPDGTIDTAFVGEDGTIGVYGWRSTAISTALQSDGGLIVAGEWENAESWLKRIETGATGGGEPGGPRDETFGGDGTAEGPVDDEPSILPVDVAVGPQDVIVATGHRTVVRYRADGSVDTSFGGGDGEIETDFGSINGVAVQGDGRIVVVGQKNNVFRVARYTTAGQLDTSFSGDGITSRGFGGQVGFDFASGVAIQPDGKIVVVGAGTTARRPTDTGVVVVRYNANGSIDTSFDNDGYSVEQLTTLHDWANDVDIAPDGRIVVGGISGMDGRVLRYTRSGSLDTSFSGDGVASVPFLVNSVDTQGDGRIVIGGTARESMADTGDRVARLTSSGALDTTFGTGGIVSDLFEIEDGYSSNVSDVLVLPGGDIMVSGSNEDRSNDSAYGVVTRLNPNGSIDEQFDSDRDYEVAFDSRGHAHALALQSTGNTIVAGDSELIRLELARYLTGDDGGGEPGGDGTGLTGTYYSNVDFTGNSITRTDAAVNFNWGTGGPSSTIGTDTFSARWTGKIEAEKTERYTFYTRTDDGVRLWVNGQLLVDKWTPQSATEWSGSIDLVAGQKYDIKMEYFERYGGALAELRWSSPSTPKSLVPTSQLYPSNAGPADTQKPTMPPNLNATANYERVILDWDASTDNVGVVSYEIRRNSVHLATIPASQTTYTDTNVDPDNGYGYDVIAIDAAGNRSDEAFVNIMTPPAPPHVGQGLRGDYYSNIDFTGSTITRTDSNINFNWGSGGPGSTIGTDTFSVRWSGQVLAEKTEGYVFHARTDDGVRLWVDGQLIIDKWVPQSAAEHSGSIDLVAGRKYDIKMEYFERYGGALAELRWSSATTPKEIVPESLLFATQAPEPEPEGGLWALIYDNMDFTDYVLTSRVSDVNFDWGTGSPNPLIDSDTFSVHFTGRVRPTKTERYTFYTQSDDGVRLRVNGQTLIDRLVPQSMTEHSGVIELEAGQEYEIGLDYFERYGSATVKLLWSSASTPKQVIPSENLVSGGILM